jgi:hypothetical protein
MVKVGGMETEPEEATGAVLTPTPRGRHSITTRTLGA